MVDGTPIYDIKPYLPMSDMRADARAGFAGEFTDYSLDVEISDELLSVIPSEKRSGLVKALSLDPRPSYQSDGEREYGLLFAGYNVKFRVNEKTLTVISVEKEEK